MTQKLARRLKFLKTQTSNTQKLTHLLKKDTLIRTNPKAEKNHKLQLDFQLEARKGI
jgi:hypothetical protein